MCPKHSVCLRAQLALCLKASPGKWFTRPYLRKTHHKKRAGGVAQGVGSEFKPQYCKRKRKEMKALSQRLGHKCSLSSTCRSPRVEVTKRPSMHGELTQLWSITQSGVTQRHTRVSSDYTE
jgi:hypothetical protein